MDKFVIIILVFLFSACVGVREQEQFLENLQKYQKSVRLKTVKSTSLKIDNIYIDSTTFNIPDYLLLFPALRVKPGCRIDYVYSYSNTAGWPYIYGYGADFNNIINEKIRKKKAYRDSLMEQRIQKIILEESDEEKRGDKINLCKSLYTDTTGYKKEVYMQYASDTTNFAYHYFIPQRNKMGYFQLLAYYLLGDHFALYWHACNNYHYIIYEKEQIEELIRLNREEVFHVCFEEEEANKLLYEDLYPKLVYKGEYCYITVYVFWASWGIFKETYSVRRNAPYEVKKIQEVKILNNAQRGLY